MSYILRLTNIFYQVTANFFGHGPRWSLYDDIAVSALFNCLLILGLVLNICVYFFCFHITVGLSVTFCADNQNKLWFNIPETCSKSEVGLAQFFVLLTLSYPWATCADGKKEQRGDEVPNLELIGILRFWVPLGFELRLYPLASQILWGLNSPYNMCISLAGTWVWRGQPK